MKKIAAAIVTLLLVVCLSAALISCKGNEGDKEQEPVYVDINTVEDFLKIKDFLGTENSHYVFELKADLDFSETAYAPIGESQEKAFTGTLNGNGHKLSNITMDGIGDGSIENFSRINPDNGYVGIFGVIYGGKVKDLDIENINVSVIQETEYGYVGGLAGYCYGKVELSNINVGGSIEVGTKYTATKTENGYIVKVNQRQYIGGLTGWASGSLVKISDVSSSVAIENLAATYGNNTEGGNVLYLKDAMYEPLGLFGNQEMDYYPDYAFIGGVAGYCDCTYTVADDGSEEITYNSELLNVYSLNTVISCTAKALYAGGLYGYVSGVSAASGKHINENFETAKNVKIDCTIFRHATVGAFAGVVYKSAVSNVNCYDSVVTISQKHTLEACNIGGVAGYVTAGSVIKNTTGNGFRINTKALKCNVGGITAITRDSDLNECKALGGGIYNKPLDAAGNFYRDSEYTAGVCYSVVGNSTVTNCASSFSANYGGVAVSSDNIYVNKDGNTILRFVSKTRPSVFIGVYAEEVEENGVKKLNITFYDESREPLGEVYSYTDFVKDETIDVTAAKDNTQSVSYQKLIESYVENYFNEQTGCFLDSDGTLINIEGRGELKEYERMTGIAVIENISYQIGSAFKTHTGSNTEVGLEVPSIE